MSNDTTMSSDAGAAVLIESRNGLGERIFDAWRNMRASTRRLIDERPSEHRLLFYVLLSDIIFFLSWSLKTVVSPVSGFEQYVPVAIALWLIGALLFRTSMMYVLSIGIWAIARSVGGTGSWKATRCGVFWGALVAAPFGLLMAILTVMMSWFEDTYPILQEGWVQLPPYWIALVPFLWLISQGISEAHGFKKNTKTFMIMSAVSLVLLAGGFVLSKTGMI